MAEQLPFIDQHSIEVEGDRETVWQALTRTFGESGGRLFTAYARAIGVDPDSDTGELDQPGSTRVGFRVTSADRPEHLELSGRHYFSTYSLTWEIAARPEGGSTLSASTHARFLGVQGRVYKAVVIDSGAHARITRRMLAAVARQASRNGEGRS